MEIKQLSTSKENEVISAIKEAIKEANDGTDASDAIAKIASAHKFSGEMAKRMVEIYNNSKTLALFKSAEFDRTETFPLADPDKVILQMFPDKVDTPAEEKIAQVVPEDYSKTEQDFTKKSHRLDKVEPSTYNKSVAMMIQHGINAQEKDSKAIRAKEFEANLVKESIYRDLSMLCGYFRQLDHIPFEKVEEDVMIRYGALGKEAMDLTWKMAKLEDVTTTHDKRASVVDLDKSRIVDEKCMPMPIVQELITKLVKLGEARDLVKTMKKNYKDFWIKYENKLAQLKQARFESEDQTPDPFEGMMKGAEDLPEPYKPDKPKPPVTTYTDPKVYTSPEVVNLLDPSFDTEMKSIRMSTMITDLMANDPVLSQSDPDEVIRLYNEISAMAPTVASEPLAIRSLLRYYIAGGEMDRMELNQIIDIEKKLKEARKFQPETQIV
jgi:hypothetical protein